SRAGARTLSAQYLSPLYRNAVVASSHGLSKAAADVYSQGSRFRRSERPTDGQELGATGAAELIGRHVLQPSELSGNGFADAGHDLLRRPMGATDRLADDFIDDTETLQVISSDLHGGCGIL